MTPRTRSSRGRRAPLRFAALALATLMLPLLALSVRAGDSSTFDPDQGPAAVRLATPAAALDARPTLPAAALGTTGTPDVIGGDDAIVLTHSYLRDDKRVAFAVSSSGELFTAMALDNGVTGWIDVYHSTDAGNTWTSWGGLSGVGGSVCEQPAIRVVEGDQDRVYVAYRYRATLAANADIRVAWSPLGAAAAWTNVIALSSDGVTFEHPSLDSDAISYSTYALYLVAAGQDGDGSDVWFTRSADFGATWTINYRIASMTTATRDYNMPEVKYGWGGTVHCVWQFVCRDAGADGAVRYRRAINRAANGIVDWQIPVSLTSSADGRIEYLPSVAAAYGNMWTVISYTTERPDGLLQGTGFRASSDAGATWPAAYADSLHGVYFTGIKALPGVDGFVGAGQTGFGEIGVMRASNSLPLSWSTPQNLNDRNYDDGYCNSHTKSFDYDPAMGNRVGAVWSRYAAGAAGDTVFFDGEWCRDIGWPNYEAGMPKALAAAPISAPAIAELDGDPQSEIVFGDAAANVQALNHDGTSVAGWPQNVAGALTPDSPIAVGDLDGDGRNEVVAGGADGRVYAWRHDGTPLAGWPVNLGFGAHPTFVALGALLPDSPRQVVVTSGTHIWVLLRNGTIATGWPGYRAAAFTGPAAIGDVDADGANEVVSLFGAYMNIQSPAGATKFYRNLLAEAKTYAPTPSLADLDLDGRLEIVAPTMQGDVYTYRWDGADQPGFPWHDATTDALTPAALANIWSGGEPEIAFTSRSTTGPHVHLIDHAGASVASWPRPTASGWAANAPIMDVIGGVPYVTAWSVFASSGDGYAYGWSNLGTTVTGWPKDLGAPSPVSPATGDIDGDQQIETVLLTSTPPQLHVVDLGAPVYRSTSMPRSWWPMVGYNSERQSCLACGPDAVTWTPPAGSTLPTRLQLDAPWPNPTHGAISLRFALPARAAVRLDVFDVNGRLVRALERAELEAGVHQRAWDGRLADHASAPAGVYYIRLACVGPAGEEAQVRRVALMR